MSRLQRFLSIFIVSWICLMHSTPTLASSATYRTGFTRWRAADNALSTWQRDGTTLADDGTLQLDLQTAYPDSDPYPAGSYQGHNFYNGGSFVVGAAVSPVIESSFAFSQAIASWNADTPAGTWIETRVRTRIGERWTRWYTLGVWAADTGTIQRHSVGDQSDADGRVSTDTLVLAKKKPAATAFQVKVRFFSTNDAVPVLHNIATTISTSPAKATTVSAGNPAYWNHSLSVPTCSQMVYKDGGEVWCSPTSTSMVLAFWDGYSGPCEPRVRAAVDGVYDWVYDGHGNWPFNAAYAATTGREAYVARFTSLADAEPWIAAGVPVIFSFAWKKGQLSGAAASSSSGHLSVLVGFDAAGNPIVNDPAAASDGTVQRTYQRAQLEPLWLANSGGAVYLIYPTGWTVPALP